MYGKLSPVPKSPEKPKRTQAERTEVTRTALISAARELFGSRGYAEVSAEEVVRAAGVTRGALYHHFAGGKPDLMEAVYEQVEAQITKEIGEKALARGGGGPVEEMKAGAAMFLEVTMEPEIQRIVLIDAPAVLGWERWREIASEYGLGLIEGALGWAMEEGELVELPLKALAHVFLGALDEAAALVARSSDPERARAEVTEILERMVDGLRPR